MYKFFAFIKFLWSATNHHGVHSPFVFAYLTRAVYMPRLVKGDKAVDVLLKSIQYFNPELLVMGACKDSLRKQIGGISLEDFRSDKPIDMLYLEQPNFEIVRNCLPLLGNDSVCIVKNIYQSPDDQQQWKDILNLLRVRVSIDMFYCGLLFFREEQAEEHFKIRI